ncbi:DUF2948 family protein [Phaeobacter inhibens]|uniref:DUF2948 family protein n=1 Tax=Phaeobacter inhibens TaxID=221822 RepID=UPI0021A31337|nr:DUF2948 family protein [Phaeobacter inhibens]UWR88073.1 DUF2948 family protein [Phaeobacter inhibens]
MADATFDDGREAPLNLGAFGAEDLEIIASLAQDAVFPVTEISWRPAERRFALLLNRFRWEDKDTAEQRGRPYERVQSVLVVDQVLSVASQGVDRKERDLILSLLSLSFEPGSDGDGHIVLTLAGDGAIRLAVEAVEVTLRDVTRPYQAPSGQAPLHET